MLLQGKNCARKNTPRVSNINPTGQDWPDNDPLVVKKAYILDFSVLQLLPSNEHLPHGDSFLIHNFTPT